MSRTMTSEITKTVSKMIHMKTHRAAESSAASRLSGRAKAASWPPRLMACLPSYKKKLTILYKIAMDNN